jgi:hypothetical protein
VEFDNILTIVCPVIGELATAKIRGLGDHDIHYATRIRDPCDFASGGRGGQMRGKGRAKDLINRKVSRLGPTAAR